MPSFIYILPPGTPVGTMEPNPTAWALPFLIHEGNLFHFGLLVADRPDNAFTMTLLKRLGFVDDNSFQIPSTWLTAFLTARILAPGPWRMFASYGADAPFISMNAATLALYVDVQPVTNSTGVILPTVLTPTTAAENMNTLISSGYRGAPFAEWTKFRQLSSTEPSLYFKQSGSPDFVNGLLLPFDAAQGIVGGASFSLPELDPRSLLTFSHRGPEGQFRVNGTPTVPDIDGYVDVDDGHYLRLIPGSTPSEFLVRWPFSSTLAISFALANRFQLGLSGSSLAILASDKENGDTSFTVEATAQETIKIVAIFPLTSKLFEGPLGPVEGRVTGEVRQVYPTHACASPDFGGILDATVPPINFQCDALIDGAASSIQPVLKMPWNAKRPEWSRLPRLIAGTAQASLNAAAIHLAGFDVAMDGLASEDAVSRLFLTEISSCVSWIYDSLFTNVAIPIKLQFQSPGTGGSIEVVLALIIDLTTMQMTSEKTHFLFDGGGFVNFGSVAIQYPKFSASDAPRLRDLADHHHGTFDFALRRLDVDLKALGDEKNLTVWLPGVPVPLSGDPDPGDFQFRFQFQPEAFDPDDPNSTPAPDKKVYVRLDGSGLSVFGKLRVSQEVVILKDRNAEQFHGDITAETLAKDPETDKGAELLIVKGKVIRGSAFAKILVPGFSDLQANLEFRISRNEHGGRPIMHGVVGFSRRRGKPVGALSLGYFDAALDNPTFKLSWDESTPENPWTFEARADALLTYHKDYGLEHGLEELRTTGIRAKNLNLLDLNQKIPKKDVEINVSRIHCTLFGGIVALSLDDLELSWGEDGVLNWNTRRAAIDFGRQGGLRGGVAVGNLTMKGEGRQLKVHSVSAVGFHLDVPGAFSVGGTVSWKNDDNDPNSPYFLVEGDVEAPGLPLISGSLRYGRVVKDDGVTRPAIAAFASSGLDQPLAPYVVLKEAGIGGGWNAKLGDLPDHPTVDDLLRQIDTLDPADATNWRHVHQGGDRVSLVLRAVFGSTVGGRTAPCAYVGTVLVIWNEGQAPFAAGKMWLLSSAGFAARNADRPSLVGAMTVDTNARLLSASLQTRHGGAIEAMPQLEAILDSCEAELDLRIAPNLVDIHLKRLEYDQSFLGQSFHFKGEWRLSMTRETILHYVSAHVQGHLGMELTKDSGGFSFEVDLDADVEYGGIIGRLGAMAYGHMNLDIHASCSAFVDVEFKTKIIECKWTRGGPKCWDDWYAYSERLSARVSVTLRLSAEFAFEGEPGSNAVAGGARGSISFDGSICGQRLCISPSFEFAGGVVDRVRNKVRSFERSLDRVKTGTVADVVRFHSMLRRAVAASADLERWILVRYKTRWILLPASGTVWFTPQRRDSVNGEGGFVEKAGFAFVNPVEKIDIDNGAVTIVPLWDHARWYNVPPIDEVPTADSGTREFAKALYRLNFMMLETAVPHVSDLSLTDSHGSLLGMTLIQDLRVKSTSRDYLRDKDKLTLPAGVYPFTFRPRSDPTYEDAEEVIARLRAAGTLGVSTTDRCIRNRAAMLELMIRELQADNPEFLGANNLANADASVTAYVRNETIDVANVAVEVTRNGGSTRAIIIDVDDCHNALKNAVKPLKVHQEFKAASNRSFSSDSASSTNTGTVVVKVAVDLTELFGLDGGGQIIDPKLFEVLQYFRIDRCISHDGAADKNFVLAPGGDRVPCPIVPVAEANYVVLRPYLFTESFEFVNGRFTLNELNQPYAKIIYRIVPVPLGKIELSDVDLTKLSVKCDSVALYVPPRVDFNFNLSMVCDARELIDLSPISFGADEAEANERRSFSDQAFTFRLAPAAAPGTGAPGPVPKLEDFELWFEEVGIRQTGYYGRTSDRSAQVERQDPERSSVVNPRRDRAADEFANEILYSTRGRWRVEKLEAVANRPGMLQFPRSSLGLQTVDNSIRRGYRFFLRPKGSPEALLRLLPLSVGNPVGNEPPEPLLSVEQFEWFRKSDLVPQWVSLDESGPSEATVSDPRHRQRAGWFGITPDRGGFEIDLYDPDERRTLLTRRLETLDEEIFRLHQRDFRETSRWTIVAQSSAIPGTRSCDPIEYFWNQQRWFVLERPTCCRGALSGDRLKKLGVQLGYFGEAADERHFLELGKAAWDFWISVSEFLADVQNDYCTDDANGDVYGTYLALEAGLVMMFAGLAPRTGVWNRFLILEAEYLNKQREVLLADPSDRASRTPEERENHARDVVVARQILAIMETRRRRALDIIEGSRLGLTQPSSTTQQFVAPVGLEEELELKLALELLGAHDNAGRRWGEFLDDYPISRWFVEHLLDFTVTPTPAQIWSSWNQGQTTALQLSLPTTGEIDRFLEAAAPSRSSPSFPTGDTSVERRSKIVPYVVGLQALVEQTIVKPAIGSSDPETLTFVTRAHHGLRIGRGHPDGSAGLQCFAQDDRLASYLPANTSTLSIEFLHLMERLGFAVDVALVSSKFQIQGQTTLRKELSDAAACASSCIPSDTSPAGPFNRYYAYLFCGQAAGAGPSGGEAIQFSFVKVLLLPKTFVADLIDASGTGSLDGLKDWLQLRTLTLGGLNESDLRAAAGWLVRSIGSLPPPSTDPSKPFAEATVEMQGGAILTIPAVRERCNLELELPFLSGQYILPRVRSLSRYQILAELLAIDVPSSGNPPELPPTHFRAFYPTGLVPPKIRPIGYSLPDRIYFVVPSQSETDSGITPGEVRLPNCRSAALDNSLVALRTGSRSQLELQFLQRVVDRADSQKLEAILNAMVQVTTLETTTPLSGDLDLRVGFSAPVFDDEIILPLVHQPYFNEYALKVHEVFEARFASNPSPDPPSAFFRREPARIAYRQVSTQHYGALRNGRFDPDDSFWSIMASGGSWSIEPRTSGNCLKITSSSTHPILICQPLRAQDNDYVYLRNGVSYRAAAGVRLAAGSHGTVHLDVGGSARNLVPTHLWQTLELDFVAVGTPTLKITWHPHAVNDTLELRNVYVDDPAATCIRVFLTQHFDNLTDIENEHLPELIPLAAGRFDAGNVPDMAFGYLIYEWTNPESSSSSTPKLFASLGEVRMPWHPSFDVQATESYPQFVRFDPDIRIDADVTVAPVQINYFVDAGGNPRFAVDLPLRRNSGIPIEPSNLFVLAYRNGIPIGPFPATQMVGHARPHP